ncbi:ABC transporter substrate-binding protein [Mesorhizobium sp. B2-3-2]|uniref:ABC transporter substrate-binding protein n=2 Tax=unclassified Mesorhizobium TaxID=325217 RepID=UPI0011260122|nr:ABC transporter substrate-binding protein [Mesorhizobium sp. B2-3-2]TPM49201.1 ABC transporter substrate-binding protein [Mesorhizobium sp. B2-3-2]
MSIISKNSIHKTVTRRQFLRNSAAVGIGLAAPSLLTTRSRAAESLVYIGYGGSTQDVINKVFIESFTKETGIEIISNPGADLAKLKAQVQTGNIEWDLVNLIGPQASAAGNDGLLEEIDYAVVHKNGPLERGQSKFFNTYYFSRGGIGFNPEKFPAGRHPTGWAEFWDIERFPGRRGLRSRPEDNLEMALIADGVAPRDVYPIDVDRAFASLDKIKQSVAHWIAETPQTVSLLQNNEVDFVFTYSSRIEAAQKQGSSVDFAYGPNFLTPGTHVIPKGTKKRDIAMQLMGHFLRPDLQAEFCNQTGSTPINPGAVPLMKAEVQANQPKFDDPEVMFVDVDWWAQNYVETSRRFLEWRLT